jgi:hypothetical protein
MALTVVVSAGALVGRALLFDPKLPCLHGHAGAHATLPVLALGFALVNAAAEEGVFSGVLQTELSSVWDACGAGRRRDYEDG